MLVVDDESSVADLYADQLGEVYSVRRAYTGDEALDRLDENVGVVLLGRRMPGKSGDEVLEAIRDREHDCQVVMVTAVKPDFDIIEMDFDDYLVKPTSEEELHAIVERMLNRAAYQGLARENFALVSKYAALKTHKSTRELRSSDEFAELEARLTAVKQRTDEIASVFESKDFQAVFRNLTQQ